jgi:protein-disulfide isomerase
MKRLSVLLLAGLLVPIHAGSDPALSALQAKVDSLAGELKTIERVLANRGLDIERERRQLALQDSTFQIPLEGTAILGDSKAPATVVLFTDIQCPYCAQMLPILRGLQADHPKTLKVSFRHFPLTTIHDHAMEGHLALWAAGRQGKLWEYYFKLAPSFRGLTDSVLVAAAKDLRMDLGRFEADRKSADARKAVESDMKLGEQVGVQGTPSLYLNGRSVRNASEIAAACVKLEAK